MRDIFNVDIIKLIGKHPDDLTCWELMFLENPVNKDLLDCYIIKWREVINQRRLHYAS